MLNEDLAAVSQQCFSGLACLMQAVVGQLAAKFGAGRPQELFPGLAEVTGHVRRNGGQAAAHRRASHNRGELLLPGAWLGHGDGLARRHVIDQPKICEAL